MRKIVGEFWLTQGQRPHNMGIVITEDEHTNVRTAYVGTHEGTDPCDDIEQIRATGAKISLEDLSSIIELMRFQMDHKTDHDHSAGAQNCPEKGLKL